MGRRAASVRDVDAPADPRATWHQPAPGTMPRTADLEPLVTRVLAPNPSPMTLDGTNTYLVGEPGSGQAVLVDPGPDHPAHLAAVEAALAARDARCAAVLVSPHHGDHGTAARSWGAPLRRDPAAPHPPSRRAGWTAAGAVRAAPSPGHDDRHRRDAGSHPGPPRL